jgi:hypothetical protein
LALFSIQIRHMKAQKRSSVAGALAVATWHAAVFKNKAITEADLPTAPPTAPEKDKLAAKRG